jgi:hypothetical protein
MDANAIKKIDLFVLDFSNMWIGGKWELISSKFLNDPESSICLLKDQKPHSIKLIHPPKS